MGLTQIKLISTYQCSSICLFTIFLKINEQPLLLQIDMNQFFSAIQVHLDDKCLIDASQQSSTIASLGIDNMIYRLNIDSHTEDRYNLDHQITYDAMALSPDASHCLIGGKNNALLKYTFADGSTVKMLETLGNITAIKYAPFGNYIAVGSEEGKCLLYDPISDRKQKCRPGHSNSICSISLSKSGNLLASIGKDQTALIYKIGLAQQPQQVARYIITNMQNCSELTSCFNQNQNILFVSGHPQLQKIECVQTRWNYSKSNSIAHKSEIIMVLSVKTNTLVTSSYQQVCIWNIKQEEKLFQIEQFSLIRTVQIAGKFYGSRSDGKIYEYTRQIREEEPMDVEHESVSDKIEFEQEQQEGSKVEQEQIEEEDENEVKSMIQFQQHKKSKADKMITCYPQAKISTSTSLFDQKRFAFVNLYGYVIEKIEGEEKIIEVQLEGKRPQKFIIAKNKEYSFFSINELGVVYANEKQFGFKPSSMTSYEEWQVQWDKIEAVTMGSGWIAIAGDSQIKILDMASHEIRSISFDRQIVALRAFENILVVVYHEGVPFWGAQQLAMQIFLINNQAKEANLIANTHVPLKRQQLLRWFDFSREGMLFSQDDFGTIRAFSLQTSQWTSVTVDDVEQMKKIWMIGIKNHNLFYWKTTDTDPEPTVAPRFTIKQSQFSISTVGSYPQGTQPIYQKLLWKRYILDHQKARTRLWGSILRAENNLFYQLRQSILKEEQIVRKHKELDQKYFSLIQKYLKAKQTMKAMLLAQNCIRSLDSIQRLVELFDYQNQRSLAIQLQEHADQRRKQGQYEQMQIFSFMKLRQQAERSIKPRSQDPMRRSAPKKMAESIPSFSQSFMSQDSTQNSIDKMNTSKISQQHSQSIQAQNPFLKKKSNHQSVEAKKKQISDQIEKFGIKQKVQKKNINKSISK